MCGTCKEFTDSSTSEIELAFAAGVMAGDGCFTNNPRGGEPYFVLALAMQDRRTVERVARCLAAASSDFVQSSHGPRVKPLRVHYQLHSKTGHVFARIWLGGPRAVHIARVLLPYLGTCEKADSALAAIAALDERL